MIRFDHVEEPPDGGEGEGGQTQPVPPTPYDQLPSPSVPAYPQPHSYGWTSPHGVPPSYGGPPT
ncbi:MAG TPA: hypothetical protein VG276_04980, partial [Actinomycetes bacterium]|nr:hypothetical protein [Actinomycetes bacterium]